MWLAVALLAACGNGTQPAPPDAPLVPAVTCSITGLLSVRRDGAGCDLYTETVTSCGGSQWGEGSISIWYARNAAQMGTEAIYYCPNEDLTQIWQRVPCDGAYIVGAALIVGGCVRGL